MRQVIQIAGIIIGVYIFLGIDTNAQEVQSFSLREAQVYALEHNYDVRNALIDVAIAKKKVAEVIATGLPQVNGTVSYNNYLEIPTQLIPGEFFGQEAGTFIPVQFGTQHNAAWSAGIDQLIFSGQYIIGLQATKAYLSLSETAYEKSEIEIKDMVAKTYYPVIILQENKIVFDSTLASLNRMVYETREYYNAGFVEETDIDQLELIRSDMETTLTNIEDQLEIARNTFKYILGINANTEVILTDKLDDLMMAVDRDMLIKNEFDYTNHIDYKLLTKQKEIADFQKKLSQAEYYPTINGFYSYQQNAMRNSFNFFTANEKWYPTQILGATMNIPIFSSGNRKYKLQQSKLEIEKLKVQEDQLAQGLSLKVRTAKSEFSNAYLIYRNKGLALKNAERIYQKTEVKYREGISTSLALSQTYNQYLTSKIDQLTSILTLLTKKAELEKELTRVDL